MIQSRADADLGRTNPNLKLECLQIDGDSGQTTTETLCDLLIRHKTQNPRAFFLNNLMAKYSITQLFVASGMKSSLSWCFIMQEEEEKKSILKIDATLVTPRKEDIQQACSWPATSCLTLDTLCYILITFLDPET